MRKVILISLSVFTVLCLHAQERQSREGEPGQQRTPQEIAEQRTGMLDEQLDLSEKQRKKVYKLYLNEAKEMKTKMSQNRQQFGGPPPGGGRGMGRPPQGGQRPQGMDRPDGERRREGINRRIPQESEEDIAKREKKMKKILTDDQYNKWMDIEKERRNLEFQEQLLRDSRKVD